MKGNERVEIGGKQYVLTPIPAMTAQRLMLCAFTAITSGNVADISDDVIMELLHYAGIVNANGAEVMFQDEDLVNTMVADPLDLLELEERMVEKNFGFLGSGRFRDILSRMSRNLAPSAVSGKQGT